MTVENPFLCGTRTRYDAAVCNDARRFELYIVTPIHQDLEQLLRRQRRAVRVRLVDAAGRREAGSSRI